MNFMCLGSVVCPNEGHGSERFIAVSQAGINQRQFTTLTMKPCLSLE